jgi:hypothetical protein
MLPSEEMMLFDALPFGGGFSRSSGRLTGVAAGRRVNGLDRGTEGELNEPLTAELGRT